ncbi:hypothetical protein GOC31_30790 [Sinorhizobium meliloti]|nr:hypothetical protein [Sinorhizobium meliloti]MDX0253003.1 hypothetical protein [Sinorhizobium meliloti]
MWRESNEIYLEETTGLAGRLVRIRSMADEIRHLPDGTYAPEGCILADVEWFSLAVVSKSTSNAHAFDTLVRERNTIAAGALIRMQIEVAMRLFGLTLVDDVEEAGARLMNGEKYSTLKLKGTKQPLRDKILHEKLAEMYLWVTAAYEDSSAYVHLDSVNITLKLNPRSGRVFFNLLGVDKARPDEDYFHLADTFFIALRMTRDLLKDFLATRPNPDYRLEQKLKLDAERIGSRETVENDELQ